MKEEKFLAIHDINTFQAYENEVIWEVKIIMEKILHLFLMHLNY